MTISALRVATLGLAGGISPAQVALLGLLSVSDRQVAQCSRAVLWLDAVAMEASVSDVTECAASVLADVVTGVCSVADDATVGTSDVATDAVEFDAAIDEDVTSVTTAIEIC
jgi:hypothetical protein